MRRGRIFGAFAVALTWAAVSVLGASSATGASGGSPTPPRAAAGPDAACIREGLAPIPVTVRAVVPRAEGAGRPELAIRWSGKPLDAGCHATRTVSFQATLWFPHLRYGFTEGLELNWLEFWNGHKAVTGEEERYGGNASYQGLGCIYRARARLRYEVVAPGGAVLGKRVVAAPVKLPAYWE